MKAAAIVAAVFCVCATAFVSGRAFERARKPAPTAIVIPPVSDATRPEPPADFGERFYADVASVSFVDVYETLSSAAAPRRVEWLHQIEELPESPRKIAVLCDFFRALVQIDPKMAGDLVVGLKRHRSPVMQEIVLAAPPSAMPQLAAMMLKLPDEVRSFHSVDNLAMVVGEWATIDPRSAADFVDQHSDLPIDQYAFRLTGSWGELDHEGALEWMQKHSNEDLNGAEMYWLKGWFYADPQGATDYALAHADDKSLTFAVTRLTSEVFKDDEVKGKQFIERLPTSEMRRDALDQVAALASYQFDDGSHLAVANFILQFPDSEWPDFSTALEGWRRAAAPALYEWIARLPPGVQGKVIDKFPGPDGNTPESSFLSVFQLGDPDLRNRLLQKLVSGLASEEHSPAEGIANLKLSAAQKAELESFLEKPK